jgi:nucleotidyltransferase substrate binding protein (TIGR01987 family)
MAPRERFALQVGYFEQACARMEEALALNETDLVRDALIKRFEFTFEMAWKAMYRWLRVKGVDIPEEAFEVIPRAFNAGLISDDAACTQIRKARNQTAHTYDKKKAIEVAALIRKEAASAFKTLLERLKVELTKP